MFSCIREADQHTGSESDLRGKRIQILHSIINSIILIIIKYDKVNIHIEMYIWNEIKSCAKYYVKCKISRTRI